MGGGGGGGDCWRAITVKPVQYEYLNPDLFLQREFIHSLEREGGEGGGGGGGGRRRKSLSLSISYCKAFKK